MNIVLWAIGIVVGGVGLLWVAGATLRSLPDTQPVSIGDQIKQSCQKQFGYQGESAVLDCTTTLMARKLLDMQRDKLDAAYDAVR